jgi:hypothetical protein
MTVNGFYFPFGTLNMTVNVFYVPLGTLCMTVNFLNMTVLPFYVPPGTLHMTVNFLNMTVNDFFLGHLLRPMVFLVVRLLSSPFLARIICWDGAGLVSRRRGPIGSVLECAVPGLAPGVTQSPRPTPLEVVVV